MQKPARPIEWMLWGVLFAVVMAIVVAYVQQRGSDSRLKKLRHVSNFTLTNQWNQAVSLSDLRGQVWLANIIFTRCPGPCLRMTRQFAEIQRALPQDASVRLVSLTADPAYDTPAILADYGKKFGANSDNWSFLTGPKEEIYELAMNGLLLAVQEKAPEEQQSIDDLFIHSTMFVLVDKKGDVRAFYESNDPGVNERILSDIKDLLRQR